VPEQTAARSQTNCDGAVRDGPAVVCTGLTKDYGQGRGVFGLDLTISRGEVFGFGA
jgi:ABC-2 type transport system ATP-binding protein